LRLNEKVNSRIILIDLVFHRMGGPNHWQMC